jgi:hypothetical protein
MKENHHRQKIWKIIALCTGVFIIFCILFFSWLYTGSATSSKAAIYRATGLPAAFVGLRSVPVYSLLARYELLKSTPEGKKQIQDPKIKEIILNKLIRDKGLSLIAEKNDVTVTDQEITELYNQMALQLVGGDEQQFEKAIDAYGFADKQAFRQSVLKTLLLERKLTAWFNAQKNMNADTFQKVESILAEAKNGADFGELAKKYSNDAASAIFSGDSGFLSTDQLASEVQLALENAKTGDIRLAFSYDGAHIIKVLGRDNYGDKGKDRVRLQQIFLKQDGFQPWFDSQLSGFSITKLVNNLSLK